MTSWIRCAALLMALAGLAWCTLSADAQDGKVPTIKEAMIKLNKGPNSLCPSLGKALKAEQPNWEEIQNETKTFLGFAEALAKHDPPRGDRASWDKVAKAYIADAKALDDAAQKKDKAAAASAHAKLANTATCNGCHKAHRG